jgi:spore maturation protein CgeB
LLHKAKIAAAVLLTESPYEDTDQLDFTSPYPGMLIMTNELVSARKYGWRYVPHSYDPEVHRPLPQSEVATRCDVLLVGTGWPERQKLLESIDWTGIDFKLFGVWPDLTQDSPIWKYHTSAVVDNARIAQLYCGAKICLNQHRASDAACSLGPRAYEIAGCGAFQLCDYRSELVNEFGTSIPPYRNADELQGMIWYFLEHDSERVKAAEQARQRAAAYTFEARMNKVLPMLREHAESHIPQETT